MGRRHRTTGGTGAPGAGRLLAVFAVILLVPVLALGAALEHVHRSGATERALDDARASARLLAQASVQPAVAGQDLTNGLDVAALADLGASVDAALREGRVVGLSLISPRGEVVFPPQDSGLYPVDPHLRAITADPSTEPPARVTTAARPQWLGGEQVRVVQVHTPVTAPADGRVLGTLAVALPYESVAAQVQQQSRDFRAVLAVGLGALYGIVAALAVVVTRRLRLQLAATDHQAHHDSLTGLPNRSLFRKRAEAAIGEGDRDVVVAVIDLNRFKLVNDTLGHEAGDVLLREVGRRLLEAVRTDDTVARLGGDEFGLVLPGVGLAEAQSVLDRVTEALRAPCWVGGNLLPVSGSVGLAAAPLHGCTIEELLRHADVAMYVAKRSGHERGAVVAAGVPGADPAAAVDEGLEQLLLEAELTQALAGDELLLHYQPLVALGGTGGGPVTVERVEALVRWQHPRRGLLGPGQFLPLAEASGQVHELTWWVLGRVVDELAQRPTLRGVALNASPTSLRDDGFAQRVLEVAAARGVDPSRLTVEMTESALVDEVDAVHRTLTRLRAAGVGLSLDDFGQGSTSLGLLGSLPFTEVKVDRAFVARLGEGGLERTIVEAVVAIAHRAGMQVVAEGVESAEVLEHARALGCDVAQGYHLGRPAPLPPLPELPELPALPELPELPALPAAAALPVAAEVLR